MENRWVKLMPLHRIRMVIYGYAGQRQNVFTVMMETGLLFSGMMTQIQIHWT